MRIPKTDPIKFLVYEKYPEDGIAAKKENKIYDNDSLLKSAINSNPIMDTHRWPKLTKEAEKYRQELATFPIDQVQTLYKEAIYKKNLQDDQNRFFNQPDANADFDYWSKMPKWSVDEAVVLSFGKSPKIVTWKRLEGVLSYLSPFVEQCIKRKDLVIRAKRANYFTINDIPMINEQISPNKFVSWVQANNIDFPEELAQKVMVAYEANNAPKTDYKNILSILREQHHASKHIDNTKEDSPLLARAKKQYSKKPKPLHTTEKRNLLKIIIGMAIDGYGYDPKARKSPIPKELEGILDRLGISVSDDTIRARLKEAATHLPDD